MTVAATLTVDRCCEQVRGDLVPRLLDGSAGGAGAPTAPEAGAAARAAAAPLAALRGHAAALQACSWLRPAAGSARRVARARECRSAVLRALVVESMERSD